MNHPSSVDAHDLETELIRVLTIQLAGYDHISSLATQLPDAFRGRQDPEPLLQKLRAEMARISHMDVDHRRARDQWTRAGHQPGSQLQELVERTRHRLQQVMQIVQQAEGEALAAKERLQPRLTEVSVRQQMRHAYQQAQMHDAS